MSEQRDLVRSRAVKWLNENAQEHRARHQDSYARRYLLVGDRSSTEVMIEVSERSPVNIWIEKLDLPNALLRKAKLRPASAVYKTGGNYGSHSALQTMDRLHRGDALKFRIETIEELDELLAGIKSFTNQPSFSGTVRSSEAPDLSSRVGGTETQTERIEAWAVRKIRPQQPKFRKLVALRYGLRCEVTGCEVPSVLDAAHIQPVASGGSDDPQNGMILRTDIHRLVDSGLVYIDPQTRRLSLDTSVSDPEYTRWFR